MDRLNKFIELAFFHDLKQKGYCYISDKNLFVLDEVSELLEKFDLNIKDAKISERKKSLNDILDFINREEFFINREDLEEKFVVLLNYQIFLDENGFDNRYKRQVRKLITNQILKTYKGVKVVREKYFYYPSKIEINFLDSLNDLISNLKKEQNKKTNFFYRGHSNLDWSLLPSIYRNKWITNEHKMYREMILRNSEEFLTTKSTFEKLTIMQHYGLPTRLLDITKNPLVALYFACSDLSQQDNSGELIIFNPNADYVKYSDSDTVSILSNLSKSERDLKVVLNKAKFNSTYTPGLKLLHLIKEEKPYFQNIIDPIDLRKTLIVKPINNNERIKRQLGYFFLFGIKKDINQCADINSIYHRDKIAPKYFIEEDMKPLLLEELEAVGISNNTLFPEIDKGAEHLKKNFA